MSFGDRMHIGSWGASKAKRTPPTQVSFPAPPPPANPPVQTPVTFDAHAGDGISPAGVVMGKRAVVADGVKTATATSIRNFDGIAWAGKPAGNGNRDTTVLIPKGVDLSKPVEVITYFHGLHGSAANSTADLRKLIEQLPNHGRNAIMVIPTTPPNNDEWMSPAKGESLTALQDEAVAAASQVAGRPIQVGSYTVEGFSGGGRPVANAARAGDLRASRINLFDSTYGEWGDDTVKMRQPGATVNVFYTEHNRERASRLQGKPGVTVQASTTDHYGTPRQYFFR